MNDQSGLAAWLTGRQPAAPGTLAAHIAAACQPAEAGAVPVHLARCGVRLLRHVAAAAGGRAQALDLLAADALVTYAFEAQAERDVDGLLTLAERMATGGDLA